MTAAYQLKHYFSLIKFSHTIFALPFAIIGFFLGLSEQNSTLNLQLLLCVILCMVFARSAAMAFNRYIDRHIDAMNPRTAFREIPSGKMKPSLALALVIANAIGFVTAAYAINPLCFALSPVALLVILGYSYTKRFTFLCHIILGIGLGLAPLGAYLAVSGAFALLPVLYALAVMCWVSGFDIIYALQDEDFDRRHQLHSIPAKVGPVHALLLARCLHITCLLLLCWAGWLQDAGWLYLSAFVLFSTMLFWQHQLVKPNDLSRVNLAFATTNGLASLLFGILVTIDLFFKPFPLF